MEIFDMEKLVSYINDWPIQFLDYGHLYQPANKITLKRTTDLQYEIRTISPSYSQSIAPKHPVGTVRSLEEDKIHVKNEICKSIIISGVINKNISELTNHNGEKMKEQICSIDSVDVVLRDDIEGFYVIDWFENVCDGVYLWPNFITQKGFDDGSGVIKISDEDDILEIKVDCCEEIFSTSRCCMEFKIENTKCYIFYLKEKKYKEVHSGCILYKGFVDADMRNKVHNSLSFLLGRPLLPTGHAVYNIDWNLISFRLCSTHTFNDAAFEIVSCSPMPIHKKFERCPDGYLVSKYISKIVENYEKYQLSSFFWRYWYATCSPVHARAAQLGACIESFQSWFLEKNDEKINSRIISKEQFTDYLKPDLIKVIENFKCSEDEKNFLISGINNLNKVPQRIITKRFFAYLDLTLSELEQKAWAQRNDSAHGKIKTESDSINTIRENKILKNILHRMLIKILDLGTTYIDRYSLEHPVRHVSSACDKIN